MRRMSPRPVTAALFAALVLWAPGLVLWTPALVPSVDERAEGIGRAQESAGTQEAGRAEEAPGRGVGQAQESESPEGYWRGTWRRDGAELAVEFQFECDADGCSGSVGAPGLKVVGAPLVNLHRSGDSIRWDIVGDITTDRFRGTVHGDTLSGAFQSGAAEGTFTLVRADPPAAVRVEEVRFENSPVTLAGSLLLPEGTGPHPAVLFLHGSGAEDRYTWRFLATHFARSGVAALTYDKRGVGSSTGDWRRASFDDLIGDALAGVELLFSHPSIDGTRIGVHGQGHGGSLAPLLAGRDGRVAFVIAAAAPGVPLAEVEEYSLRNRVGIASLPPDDSTAAATYIDAIVDVAFRGAERARLDSAWAEIREEPWAFEPPPATSQYWDYTELLAEYRPIDWWRLVRVPVLLLYGGRDGRVPPARSLSAITAVLEEAGNEQVTVRIFPEASHTFQIPPAREEGFAWPELAPGYLEVLADWVREVTGLEASQPTS